MSIHLNDRLHNRIMLLLDDISFADPRGKKTIIFYTHTITNISGRKTVGRMPKMIVLYLIDLYPKLVVLTVGLSKSLMSALLVGNGFYLCSRPRISCTDLGLSRLRVLWASMMLSENIVDGIGSICRAGQLVVGRMPKN